MTTVAACITCNVRPAVVDAAAAAAAPGAGPWVVKQHFRNIFGDGADPCGHISFYCLNWNVKVQSALSIVDLLLK